MAEASAISWTDSTFNPWVGCTKVGPGCDNCYAEALMDVRHHRVQWGAGQPRSRTSASNWNGPRAWAKRPFYQCLDCGRRFAPPKRDGYVTCPGCGKHGGKHTDDKSEAAQVKAVRRRVFCASLADVFDNEVDPAWRADLFALIYDTPQLDWLLLTKRIGNVQQMLEHMTEPAEPTLRLPPNVWLGATVVNQEEADRDIPKLLAVPAALRWLSVEPMLGPIDLRLTFEDRADGMVVDKVRPLDWVIAGGESLPGGGARPMELAWAEDLRRQCGNAGVDFHFKQLGHWLAARLGAEGKGPDPAFWPNSIRVQEFPEQPRG